MKIIWVVNKRLKKCLWSKHAMLAVNFEEKLGPYQYD